MRAKNVTYSHVHHTACWQKEYSKRPPFTEILVRLKDIEHEEFVTSTSLDDFLSIQSTWKSAIQEQFLKFKMEERVSGAYRDQGGVFQSLQSFLMCNVHRNVLLVMSFLGGP